MKRHIRPRTRLQKKLYLLHCILYQLLFGLNDHFDFPDNHDPHIHYGKNCEISANVRFITKNHDFYNIHKMQPTEDIIIGDDCWIGSGVVILPGVCLGEHTLVGASSVITKSFPNGWCVIAGNPAKIIRTLERHFTRIGLQNGLCGRRWTCTNLNKEGCHVKPHNSNDFILCDFYNNNERHEYMPMSNRKY
jgi:UDP-3-O-[3-hydroxymyristoyl] glucosamine N-acyltransferase